MQVLVTGATGHVGRLVVEQLVAAGVPVRAMTRRPQQAQFPEAVRRPSPVTSPMRPRSRLTDGVDRMYLFPVARTARAVVTLAAKAGVGRIVVLSSAAVTGGADTTVHLPVEQAVEEISPGMDTRAAGPSFMLNKLALWGSNIRGAGVVYQPFPEDGLVARPRSATSPMSQWLRVLRTATTAGHTT